MSVSVVIPSRDRAHTLGRALGSIFSQSTRPDEVIVVDDGSTDGTDDLVRSYPGVKLVPNGHARGPAGARNQGIEASTSTFLAFLDSDDEWVPHHIEDSLMALERGADACYSLWRRQKGGAWEGYPQEWIDILIDDLDLKVDGEAIALGGAAAEYSVSKPFWCFHVDTLVARREALWGGSTFEESLGSSEDLVLSYRLLEASRVVLLRSYHAWYHEGDDNIVAVRRGDPTKSKAHAGQTVKALGMIRRLVEASERVVDKQGCLRQLEARARKYEVLR